MSHRGDFSLPCHFMTINSFDKKKQKYADLNSRARGNRSKMFFTLFAGRCWTIKIHETHDNIELSRVNLLNCVHLVKLEAEFFSCVVFKGNVSSFGEARIPLCCCTDADVYWRCLKSYVHRTFEVQTVMIAYWLQLAHVDFWWLLMMIYDDR